MNCAERNVAVRCNNFVNGNWEIDQCLVTQEDPGFVDWGKQNFALREDALLFARIPGFAPIPFAQIGLIKDEYRTVIDQTILRLGKSPP
jgi:hypothetical protein